MAAASVPGSASAQSPSSSSPATQTSRKGGVPHTTSEWYTSTSPASDPTTPSPDRVSHRSIHIAGWTVVTTRGAIGNTAYMDGLGDELGVPPPEMVFPCNKLTVTHESSGFQYRFGAEEALCCVEGVAEGKRLQGLDLSAEWRVGSTEGAESSGSGRGGAGTSSSRRTGALAGSKPERKKGKGIKVSYAEEWGKSRGDATASVTGTVDNSQANTASAANVSDPPATAFGAAAATQISEPRNYDWTYSTTWAGTSDREQRAMSKQPSLQPAKDPSVDRIPVERLGPSSGELILFYDDLVLFEDELGDNGSSMLGVKVRVMPSGFLILQRFFLRVDDVVFRLFDTRMWCGFNEPTAASGDGAPHTPTTGPMAPAAAPWAQNATRRPPPASSTPPSVPPSLGGLSLGQPRGRGAGTSGDAVHPETSQQQRVPCAPPQQRLIREVSGCEAPYKDVKSRLPQYRPNDLSLLTDPGWVSQTLQTLTARQFAASQAGRSSSGSNAQHPSLAGLGAAQAVMPAKLPEADGSRISNTTEGATVLGEMSAQDEDLWEGIGCKVDVAIFE